MAFQIISDPHRSLAASLGASLGGGLGSGLGASLEQLAANKIEDFKTSRLAEQLSPYFPGKKPEEIKAFLQTPQALQGVIYKEMAKQPAIEAYNQEIESLLSGEPQETKQQQLSLNRQKLLTPEQKLRLEEFKLKQQKGNIAQQSAIEATNRPVIERIEKHAEQYKPIKKLTTEIKELLDLPDIQWGSIKSLTPGRFQNENTQKLVSKLNELVLSKGQLGKGVPSKLRLELERLSKADLWQKPGTIRYIINSIDEQATDELLDDTILTDILEKYGKQPDNLKVKIRDEKIRRQLPDPSDYEDDTVLKVGNKQFGIENGEWVPL